MGQLEQLTFTPDPVSSAEYEPRDGRYIVFAGHGRQRGGAAVPAGARHAERRAGAADQPGRAQQLQPLAASERQMVFSAVPVDRTAAGGTRAKITTSLYVMDPEKLQDKAQAGRAGRRWLERLGGQQ